MTRRRRPGLSPTLFPFLAVLVCTLGTLILLLALVAQKAEESAQELVESESESARQLAEQQAWEAEQLIAFRDKQTAEMENRRGELGHLEDHIRRLREELTSLNRELEAADNELDSTATQSTEQRLTELDAQIAAEQAAIEKLEDETEGRAPRVVIVPYAGTNGTQRRPIYLECTDEAIIIQPEGVRITADQLGGPLGPGNPIDAALRAIRDHWHKLETNAPPPYPLLLVRPQGIHAYAACRIAMDAWDDQFGYELVPTNLNLAFPAPDPQLKETLIATVDDAVRRSRAKVAGAPARYNQFAPGSGGPRPTGSAYPTLGGQAADGSGRFPANNVNDGSLDSPADLAGGDFRDGNPTEGSRSMAGNSAGLPNTRLSAAQTASGQPDGNGEGNGIAGLTGPEILSTAEYGSAGSSDSPGLSDSARQDERQFAQPVGRSATSNGDMVGGEFGPPGEPVGAAEQAANGASLQGTSSTDPSGNNPLGHQGASGSSGQINATAGTSSTQTSASGTAGASAAAGSAAGMPPQQSPPPRTFSEVVKDRSQQERNSGARGNADHPPELSSENNWALPSNFRHHRGPTMVRELRLQCAPDKLVLAGERGGPAKTVAIRDGLIEQSVRELAVEIRQRVEDWGAAMRDGRWEPVLSVEVLPGGETRYRQLETLMRNSGVRVERRRN